MEIRYKIILVDDSEIVLDQGKAMLKTFYRVYTARSASILFEILEDSIPDLILLDIIMPDIDGFETIKLLKADERYKDIPVIFLTAKDDLDSEIMGLSLGAVDYVLKPFSGPLLHKRILNQIVLARAQIALRDYADDLEIKVHEKIEEIVGLQNSVISTVADLVEFRDKQTGGHVARTQSYMKVMIAELLKNKQYKKEFNGLNSDLVALSTQLHDVGKIAIRDMILNKPDKLTDDEFELMKSHVTVGIDIIERIMDNTHSHEFFQNALIIAGTHHEKWDGTGYPMGLSKKDIPLIGRLMAICDVYDALISDRPYKKAFTHEVAKVIIMEESGKHFDPELVDIFLKVEGEFKKIAGTAHGVDGDF